MLQDKQAEEEEQKERRWACLHRLEKKGVAFMADGGVERGSAGLSRSTRRDITWPNRRSDLRLGKHPLYHLGGTACVLALYIRKRRCLRHCRRLDRAPARHRGLSMANL
jgi:hypothetical protein